MKLSRFSGWWFFAATTLFGQNPVWGPDSRHLRFARSSGLYMLDTVGNRETRIVGDLGRTSEPTWSH